MQNQPTLVFFVDNDALFAIHQQSLSRSNTVSLPSAKICGRISALALAGLTVTSAFAHPGHPDAIGFSQGFSHPFAGIDHLLAMLAVGLWAAQNKRSALWVLPLAFPLM